MQGREIGTYLDALGGAIDRELDRDLGYGCVTMTSQGAHDDMDFRTFLRSREGILRAFRRADWDSVEDFRDLRQLGLEVEEAMMEATGGINTHKGLVFLQTFLILAWVRGVVWDDLTPHIRDLAAPLRADYREGAFPKSALLNREGVRDIRQIPLSGYAFLLQGIEDFRSMDDGDLTLQLLARVDDTTTIARSSLPMLRKLQARAGEILTMPPKERARAAKDLSSYYVDQKISSGGVADLFTTIRTLEALPWA